MTEKVNGRYLILNISITVLTVAITGLAVTHLVESYPDGIVYGFALFLGVPILAGFTYAVGAGVLGLPIVVSLRRIWIPLISVPAGIVLFGVDGIICVAMAFPLVIVSIIVGWVIGIGILEVLSSNRSRIATILITTVGLLAGLSHERTIDRTPPLWAVTTQLHIDASPEEVWEQVVTFDSLEEPDELMFKAGLAYPTHATIEGEGPGAVRRCEFNTGTFVEPITIWDEPRLLRFDVTENPIPMKELSPYEDLSPAHLHGHFYSEQGEFRLEQQPDGSTILYGTTWYRQHLWPAHYWRFWSDGVIHTIHNRVLEHIKQESEAPIRVAAKP